MPSSFLIGIKKDEKTFTFLLRMMPTITNGGYYFTVNMARQHSKAIFPHSVNNRLWLEDFAAITNALFPTFQIKDTGY